MIKRFEELDFENDWEWEEDDPKPDVDDKKFLKLIDNGIKRSDIETFSIKVPKKLWKDFVDFLNRNNIKWSSGREVDYEDKNLEKSWENYIIILFERRGDGKKIKFYKNEEDYIEETENTLYRLLDNEFKTKIIWRP